MAKVGKKEIVAALVEDHGLSQKAASEVLSTVIDTVKAELTAGNDVAFVGFGTFKVKERAERQGFNPKTKEAITIPAQNAVSFKAGAALKDAVNQ